MEGVGAGGGWEAVVAEGVAVVVRGRGSLLALAVGVGGRCRGLFVAFFMDARREFLQDGELEEGGEVGDAADG